jgi:predicted branched-subunit amino acid permease
VLRNSLGVGLATGAYGLSFGAVASGVGLSVWQACATSLLLFTGASQFALVAVLGPGGSPVAGVLSALLLGSRNTLYAVRLAHLLQLRGPRRILAAQLTLDESTAMATAAPAGLERTAFFATGAAVYVFWNLATLLGALGAARLGDPGTLGLDAAVPAAFLALLAPRVARPGRGAVRPARGAGADRRARRRTPPGPPVSTWTALLLASAGCFLLKALGWAVPGRALENERVRRTVLLLPVALLAGLIVVEAFASGRSLALDARAAGLAVAAVAVLLRAPFLVVVVLAAATAALLRLL